MKIGRNQLCPCGSGKKYKKCCGLNGQDEAAQSPLGLQNVQDEQDVEDEQYVEDESTT